MPVKPKNPRHDQSDHNRSGEHPTVKKADPRDAETLAPPPRSGVHHAVPLRKGPLVSPTIPRAPAIPSWIKGLADG